MHSTQTTMGQSWRVVDQIQSFLTLDEIRLDKVRESERRSATVNKIPIFIGIRHQSPSYFGTLFTFSIHPKSTQEGTTVPVLPEHNREVTLSSVMK